MPAGTVPPFVLRFDAGSVAVGDLVFTSKTKTIAELQEAALQGAPIVRDLARCVGAAAVRFEPAHHPRSLGSRKAAFVQHVAGQGGAGVGCRQYGHSIG
jgi:hypothetical protein